MNLPSLLGAAESLNWRDVVACRTFWALVLMALGLFLMLPRQMRYGKTLGGVLTIIAAGLLASDLPLLGNWTSQGVFWFLAAITLVSAVGTISSQSPVYAAIWFAMSLLGTGGLFFFNGAQFLGVATIVVYAGAIVVTFLFVIMLAQPEGHSSYDRMSWGWFPKVASVLAAAAMVGLLTMLLGGLRGRESLARIDSRSPSTSSPKTPDPLGLGSPDAFGPAKTLTPALSQREREIAPGHVLHREHMAGLGRQLFSVHLISVELAGTLLLAALVGAVAIAIQGKPRLASQIEEALE